MAEDRELGEKSEEPTAQRREEFRRQGMVVQSRELTSALVLFSSAICLWMLSRFFLEQIRSLYQLSFGDYLMDAARKGEFIPAAKFAFEKGVMIGTPLLGSMILIGVMSSVVQIGFLSNEEVFRFHFEKLNPITGFRKILSLKAVVEGLKALVKMIAVGGVAYLIVKSDLMDAPKLIQMSGEQIFNFTGSVIVKLLFGIGTFMAVLAIFDYLFLRWDLEKQMRMTKQEVREELKSREGDPLIKARIRRLQREVANRRMMQKVPKADVIITNPTHIAVALKYDPKLVAPQLLAKGADLLAKKIRDIAEEHRIPIVENKPLARTIYKTMKIGQVIPRELYNAVAEVLAYVFRLKKKKAGK